MQKKIEEYIIEYKRKLESGEIKPYEIYNVVDSMVYAKAASQIKGLVRKHIEAEFRNHHHRVEIAALTGETATGKTVYAKNFAKKQGLTPAISSTSNDPFQDYLGQEVFILDCVSDREFTISELQDILDPKNYNSKKSRYYNKYFIRDYILVTGIKDWTKWYENEPEEKRQVLFERVPLWLDFKRIPGKRYESEITIHKWNNESKSYEKQKDFIFDYSDLIDIPDENKEDLTMKFFAEHSGKI